MRKISIIILTIAFSSLVYGQGNFFFVFIDGESSDTLTDISISLPEGSKSVISKDNKVFAFSNYKNKNIYTVKCENYLKRELNQFDFPKKNDTAKIFLVPDKETMEKRWENLQKDSCKYNHDTLFFETTDDFMNWLSNKKTEISFASIVHCEFFKATIRMEIHYDITEGGILKNGKPQYKYQELTCKYWERDLQKFIWELPIIVIKNLSGVKLKIPITFRI